MRWETSPPRPRARFCERSKRASTSGSARRRCKRADVRLISATHHRIDPAAEKGRFREDLFFRISGITITVPPLRDRPNDLPLLLATEVTRASTAHGKTIVGAARTALRIRNCTARTQNKAAAWPRNEAVSAELRNDWALRRQRKPRPSLVSAAWHSVCFVAEPNLETLEREPHAGPRRQTESQEGSPAEEEPEGWARWIQNPLIDHSQR